MSDPVPDPQKPDAPAKPAKAAKTKAPAAPGVDPPKRTRKVMKGGFAAVAYTPPGAGEKMILRLLTDHDLKDAGAVKAWLRAEVEKTPPQDGECYGIIQIKQIAIRPKVENVRKVTL